jgi:hypothetical protein
MILEQNSKCSLIRSSKRKTVLVNIIISCPYKFPVHFVIVPFQLLYLILVSHFTLDWLHHFHEFRSVVVTLNILTLQIMNSQDSIYVL